MNTRRKLLQAPVEKPSHAWHLLHEPYYPLFDATYYEAVEYWYNVCATGKQRDTFRRLCSGMYAVDIGGCRHQAECERRRNASHEGDLDRGGSYFFNSCNSTMKNFSPVNSNNNNNTNNNGAVDGNDAGSTASQNGNNNNNNNNSVAGAPMSLKENVYSCNKTVGRDRNATFTNSNNNKNYSNNNNNNKNQHSSMRRSKKECNDPDCQHEDTEEPSVQNGFYQSRYTENYNKQEARILITNYGRVLSDLGRQKAYLYLLIDCNNQLRKKQEFRDVFCGAQSLIKHTESVSHADLTLPWEVDEKERKAILDARERERRRQLSEEYKANEKVVTSAAAAAPRSLFENSAEGGDGNNSTNKKKKLYKYDEAPPEVDRTHFLRAVDWTSLKARKQAQEMLKEKESRTGIRTFTSGDAKTSGKIVGNEDTAGYGMEGLTGNNSQTVGSYNHHDSHTSAAAQTLNRNAYQKRPSAVVDERRGADRPRVTKPKNQFDGMQEIILGNLGYDMSQCTAAEAIADLKRRRANGGYTASPNNNSNSNGNGDSNGGRPQPRSVEANNSGTRGGAYYVDTDGSTVFIANNTSGAGKKTENGSNKNNFLAEVTSDPISAWNVKVL